MPPICLRQELRKSKTRRRYRHQAPPLTLTNPPNSGFEVTRGILEELARHSGLQIGHHYKIQPHRARHRRAGGDAKNNQLFVNITITTLNTNLARILEPRAPRPDLRLEALRKLNAAGIPAGVGCAPVLPGMTDSPRDLDALVRATTEAGAWHIFANPLYLKPCSAAVFMPFLEKEFPQLVESYRKRYQDRAFVKEPYRKYIAELMQNLREKYGIGNRFERYRRMENPDGEDLVQLGLF